MSDIAVLGAGAWGVALAIQAVRAGNDVVLWARSGADRIAETRRSPRLPGFALPEQVRVTGEIGMLSGMAIVAVPTQALRAVLAAATNVREMVICAKGIETGTLRLPLEIAAEMRPDAPAAVLTGPNFAFEIASGQPAAAVVASLDQPLREAVMARMATPGFRLYGSDDPIGAQIGGAAKNVIAIAAGAVTGAGPRGECARGIDHAWPRRAGSADCGIGRTSRDSHGAVRARGVVADLHRCGQPELFARALALGRGESLAEVLAARQAVTEGVTTAPALLARAMGVDMPICEAVSNT